MLFHRKAVDRGQGGHEVGRLGHHWFRAGHHRGRARLGEGETGAVLGIAGVELVAAVRARYRPVRGELEGDGRAGQGPFAVQRAQHPTGARQVAARFASSRRLVGAGHQRCHHLVASYQA